MLMKGLYLVDWAYIGHWHQQYAEPTSSTVAHVVSSDIEVRKKEWKKETLQRFLINSAQQPIEWTIIVLYNEVQ